MIQHPPKLRLEQHHKGQQSNGKELIENPVDGIELCHVGDPGDEHQRDDRAGQTHDVRRPQKRQQFIDQEGNHKNVQIIRPLHFQYLLNNVHLPINLLSIGKP